jgi:signal transduction histidine kinase
MPARETGEPASADASVPAETDERRRQRIETILQNAVRLDDLAGRLHELSRLDAQEAGLDMAPFSIAELVHDLVVKFQPKATQHDLTLDADVESDVSVRGDIGMIERLLSNLIENAIEHTPPGGGVTVRLRNEDDGVRVAVADTGVGIPAEEIPFVTQRFYQVDRDDRPAEAGAEPGETDEGSGLGLAIASEIAEAHGSALDIESGPGDGTTIGIRLRRKD